MTGEAEAHQPGLVAHVVDRVDGIHARNPAKHDAGNEILVVLGCRTQTLSDQHKVRFEGPKNEILRELQISSSGNQRFTQFLSPILNGLNRFREDGVIEHRVWFFFVCTFYTHHLIIVPHIACVIIYLAFTCNATPQLLVMLLWGDANARSSSQLTIPLTFCH